MQWVSVKDELPSEAKYDMDGIPSWSNDRRIIFIDNKNQCAIGWYIKKDTIIFDGDDDYAQEGFYSVSPYDVYLLPNITHWALIVPLPEGE